MRNHDREIQRVCTKIVRNSKDIDKGFNSFKVVNAHIFMEFTIFKTIITISLKSCLLFGKNQHIIETFDCAYF